jgi:PAS domain S-box-containing protein
VIVAANGALARAHGVLDNPWGSLVVDGAALVVFCVIIGRAAGALAQARGDRDRTSRAYGDLEAESRDRMARVMERVPVGLYRSTPDGRITSGNQALMRMLGFETMEQMLAANVWDLYVHSEDRQRVLRGSPPVEADWFVFQLRRKDGTVLWARDRSRPVRDENGEIQYFDGVIEDITEQRLAAIALEETTARFRAAFEDSPYGMTIAGTDGRLIRGNQAVADILGRSIDELPGIHFSDFTLPDEIDDTAAAIEKVGRGEIVQYEKRLLRPDGSHVWVLISLAPIGIQAGSNQMFISHVMDITDRRRAQQALEDLVRAKDELVASVSHELRTPLTVVHGLAQELNNNWMDFSVMEQKEFVALIAQQSAEVAYIVEDLLVAARADVGNLPLSCDVIDLHEQVTAVLGSVPDLAVELRGSSPAPRLYADATRVRQIVRNLLTNAQRYGGPNRSVRYGREDEIVWLEVTDDGAAIAPEEVERIFEPYHRAHDFPTQPSSVGLGLAVSLTLARLMGGGISYRHEEGLSIFRLELPAAAAARPSIADEDAGSLAGDQRQAR